MTSQNKIFLEALKRENNQARVPIWLLRQAGRYLPEYMEVRKNYSDFFEMIKKPEVCNELTLQPLRRFPLDAAITFTDILTIPDAMNLSVEFIAGKGPVFENSILKDRSLRLSSKQAMQKLDYVFEATKMIKSNINVPLIGFTGSPWTLLVYMFYGQSPSDKSLIKSFIQSDSNIAHSHLKELTIIIQEYIAEQVKAGAECIQIFDSWGGMLEEEYSEFSLSYIDQIAEQLPNDIPLILYTRGKILADFLEDTKIKCFNLDCEDVVDKYIDKDLTIQGNFDPKDFHLSDAELIEKAKGIKAKFFNRANYVFNLGSGITPDIKPEKVDLFLAELSGFSS